MCTAVTYRTKNHYFGRNLDLEYPYRETVVITPRNYPFHFRRATSLPRHYAMIGMATVAEGYPLYYEATNEKGLSMAGLNFPQNAEYKPEAVGKDNITPFEFIPWVLGQCETVAEAEMLLSRINLVNVPFSEQLPLSPLHWIISDRDRSVVVESVKEGLKVYDDPVGVLTNNPPFDFHMYNLRNYLNISNIQAENRFSSKIDLTPYSNGMGAMGIPGDWSSASRFVRASFVKLNAISGDSEEESVCQFFHILSSVAMPRGCVRMRADEYEITLYSCCCNTDKGIYYYTTYENSQITAVDMHRENLDSDRIVSYPLTTEQRIHWQNERQGENT